MDSQGGLVSMAKVVVQDGKLQGSVVIQRLYKYINICMYMLRKERCCGEGRCLTRGTVSDREACSCKKQEYTVNISRFGYKDTSITHLHVADGLEVMVAAGVLHGLWVVLGPQRGQIPAHIP